MRPECQESHQCRLRWGRWRWRRWQSQGRRERQGRWSSWSRWTWGLIIQSYIQYNMLTYYTRLFQQVACAKKTTLQLALPPRRHLPCKLRDQDSRLGWPQPEDKCFDFPFWLHEPHRWCRQGRWWPAGTGLPTPQWKWGWRCSQTADTSRNHSKDMFWCSLITLKILKC